MVTGVSGLPGNHAVRVVEVESEHVLARVPNHGLNGKERIALEGMCPAKTAISSDAMVNHFVE